MYANLWIYFVTFFFFCGLCATGVEASCDIDPPGNTDIDETDPPGTVIFTQNGSSTTQWIYTVNQPASIKDHLMAYFTMESNPTTVTFKVNKTVDLEEIFEKWHVELQLVTFWLDCRENGTLTGGRKELFVTVNAINEFSPEFISSPFTINVTEDTTISTTVFDLSKHAQDRDVNPGQNEIRMFALLPYSFAEFDGRSHFDMPNVQQGLIRVNKTLDYESMEYKYYDLNVSVEDQGGKMTWTTVKIHIHDADDQDPEFFIPGCPKDCYTSYRIQLNETFSGPIEDVEPSEIQARDRDTAINNSIIYTIKGTNPTGYDDYFSQDSITGVVNVTTALNETDQAITEIVLFLEATEVSDQNRATGTTFQINIHRISVTTTEGSTLPTAGTTAEERVQEAGPDNTLMIVLIVLAVVAFILLVAFVIAGVFFKKKYGRQRLVGPDDTPTVSEKDTDVEDLSLEGHEQWPSTKANQFNGMPTTGRGNGLPFLKDMGTGTEEQKKTRRSRRRKKEKDTHEFDGTQHYEGSAEPEFFEQKKTRVKQSSRSKLQTDPKYWITVDNDYEENTAG